MITVSNIANASRGELLCISYELLLEQIKGAVLCDENAGRKQYTEKAVEIIKMLAGDLDFGYELSQQLFRVYVYVQGLLIKGRTKKEFEEAYSLIEKIYSAYKQLAEEEKDKKPVMQNAEAVYAGLTYGRDSINEVRFEDYNRGFKA